MDLLAQVSTHIERIDVEKVILFGGGIAVAITAIVSTAIRGALRTKHTEQTRREIAAYVAEGSMSPDDGAKLLAAGKDSDEKSCCG